MKLKLLNIEDIVADREFNCRSVFTIESVEELHQSINEQGQLMPVIVVAREDGKYDLVAGFRRYKACRNEDNIWAVVSDLDLHTARVINLLENVERKQLSLLEEARALDAVFDTPYWKTAEQINKPRKWVQKRLKLLTMSPGIKKAADSGRINEGQLTRLQEINNRVGQEQLLRKMLTEDRLEPKIKPIRTHEALRTMMVKLCQLGVTGIALKALYWMEGNTTDDELLEYAKEELNG